MATVKWRGGVTAVAQQSTASVDTYDAASTYTVTIGGYTVSVAGDTDVATTAGNLVTALNAETHPYFSVVTWSNPSAGNIQGLADVAGAPFVAALSVAGGTGTVTDFADDTAATGPHHVGEAENWSGGAVPSASDDVIIDGGASLLYGLDAITSTALATLDVRQTFTGSIGLEPSAFATSLDGATLDSDGIPEYRDTHLEINSPLITIGDHDGPGAPTGSARILIDQQATSASRLVVLDTASTTALSKPAVRYTASDADADVDVRSAPGGVGIGSDPGDVVTVGELLVADRTSASSLYVGSGVTYTSAEIHGGVVTLNAAATVTSIDVLGGVVTIGGEGYTITTLTVSGGDVTDAHVHTSAAEWGTINLYGGVLELPAVAEAAARTWTTANVSRGRLGGDFGRLSTTLTVSVPAAVSDNTAIDLADL